MIIMTPKEEFEAFLNTQAEQGYVLGDIEGSPEEDMKKYTELKIAAAQYENKIVDFNLAKQAAFEALSLQHNDERIALGKLWQSYEDNDYTYQ